MAVSKHLTNWLYLDEGYLSLIRRLVGFLLLQVLPMELFWLYKATPYRVTSWRWDNCLIQLPLFPFTLDAVLWSAYAISAGFLIFGSRRKIFLFLPVLTLLTYSFVERLTVQSSFVVLLFAYCLALMFYRSGLSMSRRLIQLSVSSCYLFSVLHKMHPEFLQGHTLHYILGNGIAMRPGISEFMQSLHITLPVAESMTFGALCTELFLAIGPWFKPTRKPAFFMAFVLHTTFSILWTGIEAFAFVMWTGLLSFCDNRKIMTAGSIPSQSPRIKELVAAGLFVALLIFMPARFFFAGTEAFKTMTFGERWPWSFAMYLFWEEPQTPGLRYRDNNGQWHSLPIEGRMPTTTSTSDMLKLVEYASKRNPEAQEIELSIDLKVNGRYLHHRQCRYIREGINWRTEFTEQNQSLPNPTAIEQNIGERN